MKSSVIKDNDNMFLEISHDKHQNLSLKMYLVDNGFCTRSHFDISVNELPWMREEVMTTKNTILKIRSA